MAKKNVGIILITSGLKREHKFSNKRLVTLPIRTIKGKRGADQLVSGPISFWRYYSQPFSYLETTPKVSMTKRSLVRIIREEEFLLLGVSFLVGHSAAAFISAVIGDLLMPIIAGILGESDWKAAVFEIGPFALRWGESLGSGLHLVVVLFIAALMIRHLRDVN